MKVAVWVAAALLSGGAVVARASSEDAVNWARTQGCAASAQPLRRAALLHQTALQIAAGMPLHAALSAVGYLASESSVIHLSGTTADADVRRLLVENYCKTLTEAALRDVGAASRGRELWLILAAPVTLPGARDAAPIERQILSLVNQARAVGRRCGAVNYGVAKPLTLNAALTSAALAHSQEMAVTGEFEHRGHDGSTPAQRVSRAGYGAYQLVGENIAAGPTTAAEVTAGWLASPPHCQNIMDPRFSDIGIAFAVNTRSSEFIYWSQDFATPRH